MIREKRWADIIKMCGVLGKVCTFRTCTTDVGSYVGVTIDHSEDTPRSADWVHKELLSEMEHLAEHLRRTSSESLAELGEAESVLKEVRKR